MSDPRPDNEGRIKMATVSTPDLATSLAHYKDWLGYSVVEDGVVDEDLASSWGCNGMAGRKYAITAPESGAQVFIRFIENEAVDGYAPLKTYGWNAIEVTIQDCDALYEQLKDSPFEIVGPPAELDFSDRIYPMQVAGIGGELLYLNQVRGNLPAYDLPLAQSWVDHIFIMILGTPSLDRGIQFYIDQIGWEQGNEYNVPYSLINNAYGFSAETPHRLSMSCVGRDVNNEIDQYPESATERPRNPGLLPPGIAMVSFITEDLDKITAPFITGPERRDGIAYGGRRVATCVGNAGELVELIEAS